MIGRIEIREYGPTPRHLKKAFNEASEQSWYRTGVLFHGTMRDQRFTAEHGRKAGYKPRGGERSGISRAAFFKSYTGRKLKKWRHKRPLEWSGETRRNVHQANITSKATHYTAAENRGGGVRVAYAGARKLNFRNPHSEIRMADEFRRLIPEEIEQLGEHYDDALHAALNRNNTTSSRQV